MPAADNVLVNWQLFVDGRGFAGNCEEFNPPKLTTLTEDFKAGGLDAALKIRLGQEPMEASFSLTKMDAATLSLWGVAQGQETAFQARGALQDLRGGVKSTIEYMRGYVREVDPGAWTPQGKQVTKYTVDVHFYRKTVDGVIVHEIDVVNMIRSVNGADVLTDIRAAIGMS